MEEAIKELLLTHGGELLIQKRFSVMNETYYWYVEWTGLAGTGERVSIAGGTFSTQQPINTALKLLLSQMPPRKGRG